MTLSANSGRREHQDRCDLRAHQDVARVAIALNGNNPRMLTEEEKEALRRDLKEMMELLKKLREPLTQCGALTTHYLQSENWRGQSSERRSLPAGSVNRGVRQGGWRIHFDHQA